MGGLPSHLRADEVRVATGGAVSPVADLDVVLITHDDLGSEPLRISRVLSGGALRGEIPPERPTQTPSHHHGERLRCLLEAGNAQADLDAEKFFGCRVRDRATSALGRVIETRPSFHSREAGQ